MKGINVPMESVSDGAVKMHGYELYGREWGAIRVKRIETHDEGNSHPEPLEHISQGPDCKCTRASRFDYRECIERYGSHEHLKPT